MVRPFHSVLVLGSSLLVVACVGDAPVTQPDSSTADSSVSDAPSTDVGSDVAIADSGLPETPLVCDAGLTACGSSCVDLPTASTDCGVCGHDCGGGVCSKGICQPVVVVDALTDPVFDIDATKIYYNSADKVLSCPLAGCGNLSPTQIGAITAQIYGHSNGGAMLVGGGNVFFMADALTGTSGPYFHVCDIAGGCPSAPTILQAGSHQGFLNVYGINGGDTYVGWYKYLEHFHCTGPATCNAVEHTLGGGDAGNFPYSVPIAVGSSAIYMGAMTNQSTLVSCPLSGADCTPTTLGGIGPTLIDLAVSGNLVWILETGADGYTNGSIKTCPTTGPCTPTTFVTNQPFPLGFAVDATDVSWFTRDGLPDPADIVTCPVTGCKGGPRLLASKQTGAYGFKSDGKFVYWATPTQILRVAK
jgi:hypothetical protein